MHNIKKIDLTSLGNLAGPAPKFSADWLLPIVSFYKNVRLNKITDYRTLNWFLDSLNIC